MNEHFIPFDDQSRFNYVLANPPLPVPERALDVQVGGDHYKKMKIQPIEYIMANRLSFAEGCIIKYITRWRSKGGVEDLKKIIHYADLLIENEEANAGNS